MKLENQVCSEEPAKKLFKYFNWQDCLFCYARGNIKEDYKLILSEEINEDLDDTIPAYTVAELGEMLPNGGVEYYKSKELNGLWHCGQTHPSLKKVSAETEADVRAEMLIYLKKNKLI